VYPIKDLHFLKTAFHLHTTTKNCVMEISLQWVIISLSQESMAGFIATATLRERFTIYHYQHDR